MGKAYVPEISEVRMVRRAPEQPFVLGADDASYIEHNLRRVEAAFGLQAFPGLAFSQIPGRMLIGQLIDWWRTLEPRDDAQRAAHAGLPGTIRLLDTVSSWLGEQTPRA